MKILGICSPHNENINYETHSLYKEAGNFYDKVMLINPHKVTYKLVRGTEKPEITYEGQNIGNITTLIVRGTKGKESSIAILVRSLSLCGCDVLSPIWRFTPKQASKLLGSIERFKRGIGSSTYFAFDRENALNLLKDLEKREQFPLLSKPIAGKQGHGIKLLPKFKDAIEHTNDFFRERESLDCPLFLQNYIKFQKEYRVIVVDGKSIGVVLKVPPKDKIPANAAQNARFIRVNAPAITDFVLHHVSDEGILGVDVAIDINGDVHIIESNRAPLWEHFEKATYANVAQEILKHAVQRVEKNKLSNK